MPTPEPELIPAAAPGKRVPVHASGMPPGLPAEQTADSGDETAVSPEEQDQYDQIVAKVGQFLWNNKQGQKKVISQLNQSGREFYENVGQAAYQMVKAETNKAKNAGVNVSADAAFHAAADSVVPWLFELAEAAKIVKFGAPEQEEQQKQMALMEAVRLHGEEMLKGPDAGKHSAEAQDFYAHQVAKEADQGALAPGFAESLKPARQPGSSVAAGVRSALQEMGRGA